MSLLEDIELKAKEAADKGKETVQHLGNEAGHVKDSLEEDKEKAKHASEEADMAKQKLNSNL